MLSNSSKHASSERVWLPATIRIIGLLAWVTLSFLLAQFIVVFGAVGLSALLPIELDIESTTTQFVLTAIIYLLTLMIVMGGSFVIRQRVSTAELGVSKPVTWMDVVLGPAAFVGYLIVSSLTVLVLTQLLPSFDVQQAQEIGFDNVAGRADLVLAFIALVIIAPIAEEVLFRGYLYAKLRRYGGVIVATLLTSALFGAVHMQWNVAIDTFILSLAMCGLRELTGSIWAGTLVHMLKNGLAFTLLFIIPIV